MAGRLFFITELLEGDPSTAGDGERFEWTADTTPPGPNGGGRACPLIPWAMGMTQHTVRTDYPNARTPSEQVLGPRRKPFTLNGKWDDRYNFPGYAERELERFENMVKRGKRCRFQYGSQVLEGIITEFDPNYIRPNLIRYSFTVSVHNRPEEHDLERAIEMPADPLSTFDDLSFAIDAMLNAQLEASPTLLVGAVRSDIDDDLTAITVNRAALKQTISNRDTRPAEKPVDSFARIATQFRAVRAASYDLLLRLAAVRSDVDLAVQTPMAVLGFEAWTRSLRYAGRIALGSARAGDLAATEHCSPSAVRLYRPRAGESLYQISRKFYGTAHAWRLIYERNALRTFSLLGTETLIIPERGGV